MFSNVIYDVFLSLLSACMTPGLIDQFNFVVRAAQGNLDCYVSNRNSVMGMVLVLMQMFMWQDWDFNLVVFLYI